MRKKLFLIGSLVFLLAIIGTAVYFIPKKQKGRAEINPTGIVQPLFASTINFHSLNSIAPPANEAEWQFEISHLDMAIGSAHFEGLKSRGAGTYLFRYTILTAPENQLDTTAGQQEIDEMKTFCEGRGLNFEDAFLHYTDDTTITQQSDPQYPSSTPLTIKGWPSGTAMQRSESRVIFNVGYGKIYSLYTASPCAQQYKAYRNKRHLTTPQNGYYWDGLYVDTFSGRPRDTLNVPSSGGHIVEYDNKTWDQITNVAQDQASMMRVVKSEIGAALILPNIANYVDSGAREVSLAADGGSTEFLCAELHRDGLGEKVAWDFAKSITSQGKYFVWAQAEADFENNLPYVTPSNYRSIEERHDMFALTSYFMAKDSNKTIYAQRSKGWTVPLSTFWDEAREYDIGQPVGDYYLWKDSAVLGNKDSAGLAYKIYRRDYTKGMILFRTFVGWSDDTNFGSQTPQFSLDGNYKVLYPDGTLGSGISQIGLSLSEGVVLVPTQAGLTLTKSVDKTQVVSGGIITYTITYTNGTSASNNVVITDPIPAGTSNPTAISNGGTVSGGVITWNLGNLSPGASGSVTFKVTVN